MNNVDVKIEKGKLVITCDVSEKTIAAAPLSGSGKSNTVASTHGNVNVGNGLTLGLNLYRKAK